MYPRATPDAGDCGPAPVLVRPADVVDAEQFRAVASALVCEHALRCGGRGGFPMLAPSYCHPGFARLAAERAGTLGAPLDLDVGRACIEALLSADGCDAARDAAEVCRYVSEGPLGRPCSACDSTFLCRDGACALPRAGDPCVWLCDPPSVCREGFCALAPSPGTACGSDADCAPWLACVLGQCARLPERSTCETDDACAAGLTCGTTTHTCDRIVGPGDACRPGGWFVGCDVGVCVDGLCEAEVGIGCACLSGVTCPIDVSVCIEGLCVARPMLGEPCAPGGASCFVGACHDGICVPRREGDPCGTDSDCGEPLVCGDGACGRVLGPGEPCGAGGRCDTELFCTERRQCEPALEVGDPCGPDIFGFCPDGMYCHPVEAVCRAYGLRGWPCSLSRPCADGLRCLAVRHCG